MTETASVHFWTEAHDGPGWYYVIDEYPEEGSVGSFLTPEECEQHATENGYNPVRVPEGVPLGFWPGVGEPVKVRPIFAWYDLWVGAFWDSRKRRLYVLPLPCIGLVFEFGGSDAES